MSLDPDGVAHTEVRGRRPAVEDLERPLLGEAAKTGGRLPVGDRPRPDDRARGQRPRSGGVGDDLAEVERGVARAVDGAETLTVDPRRDLDPSRRPSQEPASAAGVTANGANTRSGLAQKKPTPTPASSRSTSRSVRSLARTNSRMCAVAASALTPCGVSSRTAAIVHSRSSPQPSSWSAIGSTGPRNRSDAPWSTAGARSTPAGIRRRGRRGNVPCGSGTCCPRSTDTHAAAAPSDRPHPTAPPLRLRPPRSDHQASRRVRPTAPVTAEACRAGREAIDSNRS